MIYHALFLGIISSYAYMSYYDMYHHTWYEYKTEYYNL